jgi:hypothetical protein
MRSNAPDATAVAKLFLDNDRLPPGIAAFNPTPLPDISTRAPAGMSISAPMLRCYNLLVPQAGLEPALLSEQDFESSASTNSTTGALHHTA